MSKDGEDNEECCEQPYGSPFARNSQAWRTRSVVVGMVLATIVTALSLRPVATAVGPVLNEITNGLSLSATDAGLLTALPGLCFAVVGLLANRLTSWAGITGSLILAMSVTTIGMFVRVEAGSWGWFLFFSILAMAGAAIGNVVLPAYIKAEFPRRAAAMSTVYTTALAAGSTLPVLFATSINQSIEATSPGRGWRMALGVWGVFGLVALLVWALLYIGVPHFRRRGEVTNRSGHWWTMFRSPTAVALMLFFGLQSMQAYIQFGWAPSAYRAGGLSPDAAGVMMTIIALCGIPGGLIMPSVVARRRWLRPSIVLFGLLLASGYLGIAFAPTFLPWLWALCLGVSGFCFPTALALIIERTRTASVTATVSGFVQPVGYLLAAAGPFLVGAAFGKVGSWPPILVVLACTSVLLVASGLVATRDRFIDNELR
ncbi:MFS transporter [Actinomycetaceae bacterium MB13-C1-2]|nr:MFS transporter [Actinomycetaceae bacterium MB13-C1-2]